MKRVVLLTLVLASLGLALPAHAAVDFLDQAVTVNLAKDPTQATILATVQVSVKTESSGISFLDTAVPLVSAKWNGTPLTVTKLKGYFNAAFAAPVAAGTEGTLTVEMSGPVNCVYGGGYVGCLRTATRTFLLPPYNGTSWYLINVEELADVHSGSIKLVLPAGHRALAMGVPPVVTQNGDGTSSWSFTFKRKVANLILVAGALNEVTSAPGGFPVRGLYAGDAQSQKLLQGIVDEGSRLVPLFQKLWGAPPVEEIQYGMIQGQTPFAGTSLEGLILLHEMILMPQLSYIVPQANHELAHLWWGTMTSGSEDSEVGFFNESLAEYSLWRGRGLLESEAVRGSGSRMNAVWYMYRRPNLAQDTPVLSPLGTEVAIFAIYHKGSTVVRTLEEAAGPAAIDAGLSAMIKAGPDKATITGFVDAVKQASGMDLAPFVDSWLRVIGYPTVKVTTSIAASSGGGVQVTLTAAGQDFPMNLPVTFRLPDGSVVQKSLTYRAGKATEKIDLPSWPAVTEIDPSWTAVRELRPAVEGDVSFDGRVDGADLIEVALRLGGNLPTTRRVDGKFDPLYDVDKSQTVNEADLDRVVAQAAAGARK